MATEWSTMKNEWSDMKKKVDNTEKKVDQILFLLKDDGDTGAKGIVHQVRDNTHFISDAKSKLAIIGLIAGALGTLVVTFIKTLIK